MQCKEILYKGIAAHELTDGDLTAVITDYGAKFQSLRYRGRELLTQPKQRQGDYRISRYGDVFETGEFSGFDQMFPNVSACLYPDGLWEGTKLPCHGEVWTQVWQPSFDGQELKMQVFGVRLPYELCMWVRLAEDRLQLRYRARNLTGYEMKYLWCCHCLFQLEDGMTMELPEAREIFNASGGRKYLGDFGERHPWPLSRDGRDLSRLSGENHCYNKYYVWNRMERNQALLRYPDGLRCSIEVPADKVPYLGVWTDENGYGDYDMRCVAPEPATAALDRLDLADLYGRNSLLPPHGEHSWSLEIACSMEE